MESFIRTERLLGNKNILKLYNSHVLVVGVGGVGGYVCEALARSGVCEISIIDNDVVAESNINRQIIALSSTIGEYKVDVMEQRLKDINPKIRVNKINLFLTRDNVYDLNLETVDYIVDAIDNVTAKIELIAYAKSKNIPVISCMGTGNKLDPSKFQIADISNTSVCPLAKVMRKELKDRNIKNVKVLYSTENPVINQNDIEKRVPMSIAFTPSIAGLLIAREVILDICEMNKN